MMTRTELLDRVGRLKTAKLEQASARHKPLLLLYAIGRLIRGDARGVAFAVVEEELGPLLASPLGVGHKTDVALPFWHLQNDGLWEVRGAKNLRWRFDGKRPLTSELRRKNVTGRLPSRTAELLRRDSVVARAVVSELLTAYWGKRDIPKVVAALGFEAAKMAANSP